MNREFSIAFGFSLIAHAAVVGLCPAPRTPIDGGLGDKEDIVVLGVVELSPPASAQMPHTEEPELPDAPIETPLVDPAEMNPVTSDPAVVPAQSPPKREEMAMKTQDHKAEQHSEPEEQTPNSPPNVPTMGQEGSPGRPELTLGQIQDIRFRYLASVVRQLENAKRYPPQSYRRGIEGMTEIGFTISAKGMAHAVYIHTSSGHGTLDSAVQDMVARASPFDPMPPELGLDELRIVVPVVFRIDEVRQR